MVSPTICCRLVVFIHSKLLRSMAYCCLEHLITTLVTGCFKPQPSVNDDFLKMVFTASLLGAGHESGNVKKKMNMLASMFWEKH